MIARERTRDAETIIDVQARIDKFEDIHAARVPCLTLGEPAGSAADGGHGLRVSRIVFAAT